MNFKNYLKNFINPEGYVSNFDNGQFFIQNYMKLCLVDIEQVGLNMSSDEQDRIDKLSIKQGKELDAGEEKYRQVVGEQFSNRRKTKIISKNTVYGAKQKMSTNFYQTSIAGLNPLYITDMGLPNATAIEKRLREIVPSTELKEQRIHRFFNSTIMADFYDNATALLTVLLQFYWKLKIIERMDVHRVKVEVKLHGIENIRGMDPIAAAPLVCNYLANLRRGVTAHPDDIDILNLTETFLQWLEQAPPRVVRNDLGVDVPNPDYMSLAHEVEFVCQKMYDYNDGHSSSGRTFGDVFGFTNNCYKVHSSWNQIVNDDQNILQNEENIFPDSQAAYTAWEKADGFINCSGLTPKMAAILNMALRGNKRSSPLLVDQDLKLLAPRARVIGFYVPEYREIRGTFTSDEVARTISILVGTHRWHEDLLNATNGLKYWLAQPATETVEAHWWHTIKREYSLPKLGLKRAVMGMLLEGDGVMITSEAVRNLASSLSKNDELIFESAFMNACWYWGEYLMFFNSLNAEHTLRKLSMAQQDSITPFERADAIVSSMLGVAIPKCIYRQQATFATGGIIGQLGNRVKFGNIVIEHMQDYGYTVAGDGFNTQTLVPPSGVALVVGLGGPLIAGTPYGSIFGVRQATLKRVGFTRRRAYHYNDLWGMGVVTRWLGYDLHYLHPRASNSHRIYAANDISVAMPPVNIGTLDTPTAYEFLSLSRRQHVFGSDLSLALNCKMVFQWQRDTPTPLARAQYNSPVCYIDERSYAGVRYYKGVKHTSTNYQAYLLADYDYVTSDFQVTYPELAVPLPVPIGDLKLAVNDVGPPNTEPHIIENGV